MKLIDIFCRVMLGMFFMAFGLDGFLDFLPAQSYSPTFLNFLSTLKQTGYILPIFYGSHILAAVLLLIKFASSFSLLFMFFSLSILIFIFIGLLQFSPTSSELLFFYFLGVCNIILILPRARNYLGLLK